MFARLIPILLLAAALPLWSQVDPEATGGATAAENDTDMVTPPSVSGMAYPTTFGSDTRSNSLSAEVTVDGGYITNVLPNETSPPTNNTTFSILPTFALSRITPREDISLTYSPSFLLYLPTSTLNAFDQGLGLDYKYRLNQRVSVDLSEAFYRSSNIFDQSYLFSNGGITGTTQSPATYVIPPFVEQLTNTVGGIVSYQFGRDSMVGAGGNYSTLEFPNSANLAGLSNSDEGGTSAFYDRRLTPSQYVGFNYLFDWTTSRQPNIKSAAESYSILPFYTIYFNRKFSLSATAGVSHSDVTFTQAPESILWSPSVAVSAGLQTSHTNFAAHYAHAVLAGTGLLGAFYSDDVEASGGWKMSRNWSAAISANYLKLKNAVPQSTPYAGGTTISGQASLTRIMGEHVSMQFGYLRLHEEYSFVTVISANPDSNDVYVKVTYQFQRPLGR